MAWAAIAGLWTEMRRCWPAWTIVVLSAYAALGTPPQQAATPPSNNQKFAVVYEDEDEPAFYLSSPASGVSPARRGPV